MELDMMAAAALIWLPRGEVPTIGSFEPDRIEPPPASNPETLWLLRDAIVHACEVSRVHDKVPWIKTGGTLLDEDQIFQAYLELRAER